MGGGIVDRATPNISKNASVSVSFEQKKMPGDKKHYSIWNVKQDQEQESWLKPLINLVNHGFSFIGQRFTTTTKPENKISPNETGDSSAKKRIREEVYYDALTQEQWNDKYRKITLSGKSNQLMQWVIFNDKTNSKNIGVSKNPIGYHQIKQLKGILSELKMLYPVDTPTVNLVYEVFQPELLDEAQKEKVDSFFKNLEATSDHLKVIDFYNLKDKIEYGDTASKLRLAIIKQEETGLRKKLLLLDEFTRMVKNIDYSYGKYGNNIEQRWQNMVQDNPWLQSINGQEIVSCYDENDKKQIKVFKEFKRQLDMMSPEKIHGIDVLKEPQPLTGNSKALYIDLQRCVLLNDSDIIQDDQNSDGCLIYRDFDTAMTAAMPDISLTKHEILGVADQVCVDSNFWDMPVCNIVENAVMGVACPKNVAIKTVIETTISEVIESTDPDSLQKNNKYINDYNYIYDQLSGKLISPKESTFTHSKNGSLQSDLLS